MLLRDQHKDANFGDFLSAYVTCGSVYSVCALLSCPPFTYKYPHYTPKSASTPSSTIVFVCFSLLFLAVFVFFFFFVTIGMTMRLSVKQILAALVAAATATCAAVPVSTYFPWAYWAMLHVY